jgi:hypothetical protein
MKELHSGKELIDGEIVEEYAGRFTGVFDVDPGFAAALAIGDQVSFLVTARVTDFHAGTDRQTGSRKRTNKIRIESAIALEPNKARHLYDTVGARVQGVNAGLVEAPSVDTGADIDGFPTMIELQDTVTFGLEDEMVSE